MILAIREHVEANQWLCNVDPHELPQEEWEDLAGMEVDAQDQFRGASSQSNPNPVPPRVQANVMRPKARWPGYPNLQALLARCPGFSQNRK